MKKIIRSLLAALFIIGGLPSDTSAKLEVKIAREDIKIGPMGKDRIRDGIHFVYSYFDEIFRFPGDLEIEVLLFGNSEAYRSYRNRMTNTNTEAGFYMLSPKRVVIHADPRYDTLSILFHESSHAILHEKFLDEFPDWVDEGLAEYLETVSVSNRGVEIAPQVKRYEQTQVLLADDQMPALREYLSYDHTLWNQKDNAGDPSLRSIAWSLIYYFNSTESGRKSLGRFLNEIRRNPDLKKTSIELLEQSAGTSIEMLEISWKDSLKTRPGSHYYPKPSSETIQIST